MGNILLVDTPVGYNETPTGFFIKIIAGVNVERDFMGPLIVVPDACVLIPASLRDTIFRMSIAGMYDIRLTNDIIEEVRRNLVEKLAISESEAQRLVDTIKIKFERRFVVLGRDLINKHHKRLK